MKHATRQVERAARAAAGSAPPPILQKELAERWMRLGQAVIDPKDAVTIWNSALRLGGGAQGAAMLAPCLAAGAVVHIIDQVVAELCGPPKNTADPFAELPPWAVALFKRVGVIRPPASAEPATPKPIESIAELQQRAAAAGIVLA